MKKQVISAVMAVVLMGGWYVAQAGPMGGKSAQSGQQFQTAGFGCRQQAGCKQQAGCRQKMGWRQDGGEMGRLAGIGDELGLTDSQRQQIETIIAAQREQDAPLMEKIAAGKQQLWEASRGGAADEAAIADLAAEQGKLMSEMMVSRIQLKSQIFAVLTPEQQTQAAKLEEAKGPGCGGPGCGLPGCGQPGCGLGPRPEVNEAGQP